MTTTITQQPSTTPTIYGQIIQEVTREVPITPCNKTYDDNYYRHVGYQEQGGLTELFNPVTIKFISQEITKALHGIYERPIVVPDSTIGSVLSATYQAFRPEVGSIYSRYNIAVGDSDKYGKQIIEQTIEVISNQLRTQLEIEEANKKLSVWTTVLGSFNDHGLRGHDIIKISRKRPARMQFNMNY